MGKKRWYVDNGGSKKGKNVEKKENGFGYSLSEMKKKIKNINQKFALNVRSFIDEIEDYEGVFDEEFQKSIVDKAHSIVVIYRKSINESRGRLEKLRGFCEEDKIDNEIKSIMRQSSQNILDFSGMVQNLINSRKVAEGKHAKENNVNGCLTSFKGNFINFVSGLLNVSYRLCKSMTSDSSVKRYKDIAIGVLALSAIIGVADAAWGGASTGKSCSKYKDWSYKALIEPILDRRESFICRVMKSDAFNACYDSSISRYEIEVLLHYFSFDRWGRDEHDFTNKIFEYKDKIVGLDSSWDFYCGADRGKTEIFDHLFGQSCGNRGADYLRCVQSAARGKCPVQYDSSRWC